MGIMVRGELRHSSNVGAATCGAFLESRGLVGLTSGFVDGSEESSKLHARGVQSVIGLENIDMGREKHYIAQSRKCMDCATGKDLSTDTKAIPDVEACSESLEA